MGHIAQAPSSKTTELIPNLNQKLGSVFVDIWPIELILFWQGEIAGTMFLEGVVDLLHYRAMRPSLDWVFEKRFAPPGQVVALRVVEELLELEVRQLCVVGFGPGDEPFGDGDGRVRGSRTSGFGVSGHVDIRPHSPA